MMMMAFHTFILLFLFLKNLQAIHSPQGPTKVIHERRIPNDLWSRTDRLHPSQKNSLIIPFRFGLKQSNLDRLQDELMKVSSPDSPHYTDYWDPEKVSRFFSPSNETVKGVLNWLEEENIDFKRVALSKSRAWINVDMSISQAERLLDTKFYKYVNTEDQVAHLACENYKIPRHLVPHIDIVLPSVHFDTVPLPEKYSTLSGISPMKPPLRKHKGTRRHYVRKTDLFGAPALKPVLGSARNIGSPESGNIPKLSGILNLKKIGKIQRGVSKCGSLTTIDCLKALYKFGFYKLQNPKNNSLAIVEFTPQTVIYSDLDMFFSTFSPRVKGGRPKLVSISGGTIDQTVRDFGLNGESNLDLQYSMSFVHPLNVSLYQVGDSIIGGSFNNFLDALDSSYCQVPLDPNQDGIYPDPDGYNHRDCGIVKPANVVSTSYGMNEADASSAYLKRQCNEYAKLGLMGVTMIFSSGDNGVAGNRGLCLNRDGLQSSAGPIFSPSFPGTCPYVTSIGATQLPAGKTVNDSEVACYTRIRSGGGFSNVFPLPKYQATAVKKYFKFHHPPYNHTIFNSSQTTRGFPDISANGANFVVAVVGRFGLVYGTSASAPVVASILTMINDARISLGKKPIGFINPAIYSTEFRRALNDITRGSNPGCGSKGFSAVTGWDPVTGLGTPNFSKLLPLWTKLR